MPNHTRHWAAKQRSLIGRIITCSLWGMHEYLYSDHWGGWVCLLVLVDTDSSTDTEMFAIQRSDGTFYSALLMFLRFTSQPWKAPLRVCVCALQLRDSFLITLPSFTWKRRSVQQEMFLQRQDASLSRTARGIWERSHQALFGDGYEHYVLNFIFKMFDQFNHLSCMTL